MGIVCLTWGKLHYPGESHTRTFAGVWEKTQTDNACSVLGNSSVLLQHWYEGMEKIQTVGRDANRK